MRWGRLKALRFSLTCTFKKFQGLLLPLGITNAMPSFPAHARPKSASPSCLLGRASSFQNLLWLVLKDDLGVDLCDAHHIIKHAHLLPEAQAHSINPKPDILWRRGSAVCARDKAQKHSRWQLASSVISCHTQVWGLRLKAPSRPSKSHKDQDLQML